MSVKRRGNKGVFYMNFTVNGVRIYRTTGKYSKKEALQVEAQAKQKLLAEATMAPHERNAKLLLEDAIKQVQEGKWKHNKDQRGPKLRCRRLLEIMGNVPLSQINEDVVANLIRKLEKTCFQPSSINRYLATLKTILRYKRQPWDYIKLRKERKGRIRVISRDEEIHIIDLLRNTEHPKRRRFYPDVADLVEVLVDTGMRLSELLYLTYEEVNYQSNLIHIWINKGEKPRSIPMTKRVAAILKKRQEKNHARPFKLTVFQSDKAWAWAREQIGMQHDKEFIIHALRHTCASRLVNKGVDLYVVKEWLGHSSIQVTERYAHLAPHKLKYAAQMLEEQ